MPVASCKSKWILPPTAGFFEKVLLLVASGNSPDLVYNNGPLLGYQGILEDLNPFMQRDPGYSKADYFEEAQSLGQLVTLPGQQLILMMWASSRILRLNMDAINESGLVHPIDLYRGNSWTWEKFDEYARKLVRQAGDGTVSRYAINAMDWFSPLYQDGGRVLSEDLRQVLIDSSETIEAFDWLRSHRFEKGLAPPPGVSATFPAGQLGMSEEWPDLITQLEFAVDMAPLPKKKREAVMLGCSGVSMLSSSRDKEAAWQAVRYLIGPEVARRIAYEMYNVPVERRTALAFLSRPFGPPSKLEVLTANMQNAVAAERFTVPFWADVNGVLTPHLQRIFSNQAATANELRSAAGGLQGLLKEFNAKRK